MAAERCEKGRFGGSEGGGSDTPPYSLYPPPKLTSGRRPPHGAPGSEGAAQEGSGRPGGVEGLPGRPPRRSPQAAVQGGGSQRRGGRGPPFLLLLLPSMHRGAQLEAHLAGGGRRELEGGPHMCVPSPKPALTCRVPPPRPPRRRIPPGGGGGDAASGGFMAAAATPPGQRPFRLWPRPRAQPSQHGGGEAAPSPRWWQNSHNMAAALCAACPSQHGGAPFPPPPQYAGSNPPPSQRLN